jgi:quinol monooxygenase YgiN
MSISLLVAALGCLAAAAGTGLLIARCLRAPNGALVAWTVALFGLAVSLAAQAVGHAISFGPVAFRAMEIGAGVIAPLALAVGLTEVAGKSVPARFAARLVLPAVAFVSVVILASDPLSVSVFSKAWPDPAAYYQIIPNQLLKDVIPPVVVLIALIALAWTGVRSHREKAWRDAVPPVAAAAAATLAISVPGLAALAGSSTATSLHVRSIFALLCVAAVALTWFAGLRASRLHLQLLRQHEEAEDPDEWALQRSWNGRLEQTGEFEPLGAAGDPYGSLYRGRGGDPEYDAAYGGPGYPGQAPGPGGYQANGAYHGPAAGPGYDDTDYGAPGSDLDAPDFDSAEFDAAGGGQGSETWRGGAAGHRPAEPDRYDGYQRSPADDDGSAGARLFGQIAIYTLLEDRVSEFDRLTKHVVKQVRANEPDTLVFIVHAVPSAPMQRILYEVYRDRAAFEAHKSQPYVTAFESDRRPYVLATNVIELGLQQAKVSPLPSISDLLSDTGYDLLNDSGFGQPGFGPRSAAGASPPSGPGPAGRPGSGSGLSGPPGAHWPR